MLKYSLSYKVQVHQVSVAYNQLLPLHSMFNNFLRTIDKDQLLIVDLRYFLRCKYTNLSSRCCLPTIFTPLIHCLIIFITQLIIVKYLLKYKTTSLSSKFCSLTTLHLKLVVNIILKGLLFKTNSLLFMQVLFKMQI